ncbi:MAG: SIS domain-containing protein, partial [Anaerolineaceae bacterium]|nr:SIS domain-containing protein [Anaerolineaceae bacterium]
MTLHSEIFEQPDRLSALLKDQRAAVQTVADEIRKRDVQFVFLAARGTSDNAGRYANYLLGGVNGLPLALATPSLFTFYHTPPRLHNALVIGISQSGQSPDIVSVLAEGQKQGCLTLALTNIPDSPLSKAAYLVLDLQAGPEKAVAATKTYTAQLMTMAMLSAALKGDNSAWDQLEKVAGWVEQVLMLDSTIAAAAQRYRYMQQCVVLGRGYNYATAFEWAIKLKELTYIGAEPYSSADFAHGPIAIVDQGFPVMAVAPKGMVFDSMLEMMLKLKNELKAEMVVISNDQRALDLAEVALPLPADLPEWLSPIPAIVAGQLFAYHLTVVKGYNPEQPRIIHKVTE